MADGFNVYAYVGNNPINYIDPRGLAACPSGYGPVTPQGQPQGLPPTSDGRPWKWSPNPNNSRGGTWTGAGGENASWDQNPKGRGGRSGKPHWDHNDGKGNRGKFGSDGKPVTDEEAHPPGKADEGSSSCERSGSSNVGFWAATGLVVGGVAIIAFDAVTIPSGEGLIGVGMIGIALQ